MLTVTPVDASAPSENTAKQVIEPQAAPVVAKPATETPAPEVKKEEKEVTDPKFDELARREKAARNMYKQAQEMMNKVKDLETKLAQAQAPKEIPWQQKIKQDFMGTISEVGMTPDDVYQQMLSTDPSQILAKQMDQRFRQLEEQNQRLQQQMEEREQSNVQGALKQMGVDVKKLVDTIPDQYEMISLHGEEAQSAVVELVKSTFEQEGYVMDLDEAANAVEDYLLERSKAIAKAKKLQALNNPVAAPAPAQAAPKSDTGKPASSLTHQMMGTTKPLTAKERRERAIAIIEGKLSS